MPQTASEETMFQTEHFEFDVADDYVRNTFNSLANAWEGRTAHFATTAARYADQSYQDILAMEWRAVPFILERLEREPDFWFDALKRLTGENNVTSPRDSFDVARQKWLEWGKRYYSHEQVEA